jgi:hypothetical protein
MYNFVNDNLGSKEAQSFLNDFQSKLKLGNKYYQDGIIMFFLNLLIFITTLKWQH